MVIINYEVDILRKMLLFLTVSPILDIFLLDAWKFRYWFYKLYVEVSVACKPAQWWDYCWLISNVIRIRLEVTWLFSDSIKKNLKPSLTFLLSFPRRGTWPQLFGRFIAVNVVQEFFFCLVVIILRLALLQGQINPLFLSWLFYTVM